MMIMTARERGRPGFGDRAHRLPLRLLAVAILASLAVLPVTSCQRRDDSVTAIRLAHGLPTSHPVHKAMERLAQRVAESSGGTMRIDIFPGEQLGTEREVLELMQIGSIGLGKVSCAVMESFVPEYEVLSLPYVFRDADHCWSVLQGPIGREILSAGEAVSLRGLCFYDAGARSFYTVDKPIRRPEDLAGLKIRVQESPTAKALINALGGAATPIPWGELYSALQQGVVDGAENNPPSLYLSHHFEIARYYSLNEHTYVPDVVLVSTHLWDTLSEQQRRWLQEAADESAVYQRQLWKEVSDDCLAKAQEAGVEVIEVDRQPFAERAQPLLDAFAERDPKLATLLDRIAETH